MNLWKVMVVIGLLAGILFFHFFALMRIYPLYVTSPILFIAIYLMISRTFTKRTFRGFTK
ncbi:hypothetical protein EQV77_10830 [Halobacillus fulvus]|nr:hypothetical protein EQV77_10830 [Halobacillus fulvus]